MADDVTFQTTVATPPSGTKVATDDVSGVHFQRVKLDLGADGATDPVIGTLPVSGTVTVTEPVTVDGTVEVSNLPATQPVSGTVAVTHAALTELGTAIDTELQVDVVGALPAGTNNIGDVDVLTLPALPAGGNAIGTVGVTSLPALVAGTANIGDVDVLTLPALPAGANAIGTVGVTSLPALVAGNANIGDVDVLTLPALPTGTNNIGDVDVLSLPKSATATLANVASSATSVTLQASNAARLGCTIHNDSTQILYVKFGTTASATSYTVKMVADAYFEVPFSYTGRIDGIWASANGSARMTEMT